jgi:hypothetical protein
MAIELNHTIVPARDPKASAQFLARIPRAARPGRSTPARTAIAAPTSATLTGT